MSRSPEAVNAAKYEVARARWRADLLDMDAALYDQIGKTAEADKKRSEAEVHRADADATEEFEAVIAEHGGNSPEGYAAAEKLAAHRRYWREIDVLTPGGRENVEAFSVWTQDNFTDPTADELGVS